MGHIHIGTYFIFLLNICRLRKNFLLGAADVIDCFVTS